MTAAAPKPVPVPPRPPEAVFRAAEALARIIVRDELRRRENQR
jgi:hypothetical protein